MNTEADYAWAAGFIEADGSFTFRVGVRSDNGQRYTQAVIQATQYNPNPLLKLASIVGEFSLTNKKKTQPEDLTTGTNGHSGRNYHKLSITNKTVIRELINQLLPHMSSKIKQAELLYEACGLQIDRSESHLGYTNEVWSRLEGIGKEIKRLNARREFG